MHTLTPADTEAVMMILAGAEEWGNGGTGATNVIRCVCSPALEGWYRGLSLVQWLGGTLVLSVLGITVVGYVSAGGGELGGDTARG